MNPKIAKTVARGIAAYIVETHGENIDALTIAEMTADQLPDLEGSSFEFIETLVANYISVSNIHVSFDEWKLDRFGNKLSEEQLKARTNGEILPVSYDF